MCKIPIVVFIFKRCNTAQELFNILEKVKPTTLYIIADGARENDKITLEKCLSTRAIFNNITWNCSVKRLFSNTNLGCDIRIITGLNQVFDEVDRAIILEDDCIPNETFFAFCEELLEKYKEDTRIMQISGENKITKKINYKYSYTFSQTVNIWGWATWARAWKKFDYDMKLWPEIKYDKLLLDRFIRKSETYHWSRLFDLSFYYGKKTWDSRWCYTIAKENGLSIVPCKNLIENIGTNSEDATHGTGKKTFKYAKKESITFPLKHPPYVMINPKIKELERKARVKEQDILPYPLNKWASMCKQFLKEVLTK